MRINKSAARTIDIIELLSKKNEPLTLTEISESLGIPKTSTFDIIYSLLGKNILEYENEKFKTFQIGLRLFEVTLLALGKTELHREAHPKIDQLLEKTGGTVFLAVQNKDNIVYLDKAEGVSPALFAAELGERKPIYCTGLGKAILAGHTDAKVRGIIKGNRLTPLTENTITTYNELLEELEATRERGYAIDNQECVKGIFCVAAPIYSISDKPIAAISIAVNASSMDGEKLEQLATLIPETALIISRRLGYSRDKLFLR
jgi:DNA-binding IclR family transcriptional regulator